MHGFRGRPRLKESLAKRKGIIKLEDADGKTPAASKGSLKSHENVKTSPKSAEKATSLQIRNTKEQISGTDAAEKQSSDPKQRSDPKDGKNDTLARNAHIDQQSGQSGQIGSFVPEFHIFQDLFPSLMDQAEFLPLVNVVSDTRQSNSETPPQNGNNALDFDKDDNDLGSEDDLPISDFEENMMLKHFFKKLLPLFDAHPSSPWPQLALKYCDFEVSKSCFIALSCIHLYEQKGAKHFYRNGMVYINNTMEYLIEYLKDKSNTKSDDSTGSNILDVDSIVANLKKQPIEKQRSNFFVILLLIHVHSLFSIVESGRSALVRTFFELFAAIVKDSSFSNYLGTIDESSILVANLAWFDTITAVVSPDCRLPYCEDTWYGTKDSPSSTTRLMGCPGEIFTCISRFCKVRKQLKDSSLSSNNRLDLNELNSTFDSIRTDLLNYRDYVVLTSDIDEEEYQIRLKCAQCWALAVLINLYRLLDPKAHSTIHGFLNEFIATYNSMERTSPLVTQMVWPIFTIGCVCETEYQRRHFKEFIDDLYSQARMGTIHTIDMITQECWNTGKSWEEILSSKEWYGSGIDFLVV